MKQKSIAYSLFALSVSIVLLVLWMTRKPDSLKTALELAGSNRTELEKVLDYYSINKADSLKLNAAKFLIENMPGHFSYDTSQLHVYRPVIDKISSLKARKFSDGAVKEMVNPIMDSLIGIYPLSGIYSKTENDLTSIKSELLINTIEQAFDSYNKNLFKDSIKFDDFLEYILPYRVQNGYCLEEWRPYFTQNYLLKPEYEIPSVHHFCDSLLCNFRNVKIGWLVADKYPYLKLKDYLRSKITHCPQKCWFNCLLLRSFGIPTTIDFVPASRVHELGHEWNVIKLRSGIYPFESFWEDKNRYLKAFYGQTKIHPKIGPIQFPKIYRKTYKANISELLNYAANSGEEIPILFRDPYMKDVTNEYFNTFSFNIPISKNFLDTDYAYVCVMGLNQWIPVDYGKIKNGKILFSSLGPNNVYLPSLYKSGNIIPIAYPFLVSSEGKLTKLCPDTLNTRKIEISYVAYPRPDLQELKEAFIGATIEGSNYKNFENSEILYHFNKLCEPGTYHFPINSEHKYRYFRVTTPGPRIKLNEFKFLVKESNINGKGNKELIYSNPRDSLLLQKIIDGDLFTGAFFTLPNKLPNKLNKIWFGYDFKVPVSINAFEFYFVFDANIREEGVYELLYWDFGWKSLGIKKSVANTITFDKVPKDALLMIKIHDTDKYSRPFTYSNGEQHWW